MTQAIQSYPEWFHAKKHRDSNVYPHFSQTFKGPNTNAQHFLLKSSVLLQSLVYSETTEPLI